MRSIRESFGKVPEFSLSEVLPSTRRTGAIRQPGDAATLAFAPTVIDPAVMMTKGLTEISMYQQLWICSPRGSASVLIGKYNGYLSKFEPSENEDGEPTMTVTISLEKVDAKHS